MPSPLRNPAHRPRPHRTDNLVRKEITKARLKLLCEVLATMAAMSPTLAADDLAARLKWSTEKLDPMLDELERRGMVESWPDPDRLPERRWMLSARALYRIGLALAASGKSWVPERPRIDPALFRIGRKPNPEPD